MSPTDELDSDYYEKLACQHINELKEDLHTLGFALAYHIKVTEEAKQNYLAYYESLKKLRRDYESVDRALAQFDGRFKQCPTPADEEKSRRKKNPQAAKLSLTPAQYASLLSQKQKEELLKQLMDL